MPGVAQSSSFPVSSHRPILHTIQAASHTPRITPGMQKLPTLKSVKATAKEP